MDNKEWLYEVYTQIIAERFTPKEKCSHCYGSGEVLDYSSYPNGGTACVSSRSCDKCCGKGEVSLFRTKRVTSDCYNQIMSLINDHPCPTPDLKDLMQRKHIKEESKKNEL